LGGETPETAGCVQDLLERYCRDCSKKNGAYLRRRKRQGDNIRGQKVFRHFGGQTGGGQITGLKSVDIECRV